MSRAGALEQIEAIRASLAALEAELSDDTGQLDQAPDAPAQPQRQGLSDAGAFFDYVRQHPPLGPSLSQAEVDGCVSVLGACVGLALAHAAYILATAYHETAGTLRPIAEYGKGHGKPYGVVGAHPPGVPYGRGYVQLTWDTGYEKADKELGLGGQLVANYDLALDPDVAAKILVRGMTEGWFTGKSLSTLPTDGPATHQQFMAARKIVNGTDRADLIAGYADTIQAALQAGGWA